MIQIPLFYLVYIFSIPKPQIKRSAAARVFLCAAHTYLRKGHLKATYPWDGPLHQPILAVTPTNRPITPLRAPKIALICPKKVENRPKRAKKA